MDYNLVKQIRGTLTGLDELIERTPQDPFLDSMLLVLKKFIPFTRTQMSENQYEEIILEYGLLKEKLDYLRTNSKEM